MIISHLSYSLKISLLWLIISAVALWFPASAQAQVHPFLMVKASDYAALQAKSTSAPWSQIKSSALQNCNKNYADNVNSSSAGTRLAGRSENIRYITGGCSLMYILDSANKATYRTKIVDILKKWPEMLADMNSNIQTDDKHGSLVIPGNGYIPSVIALDIIVNDLSSSDRQLLEKSLDDVAEFYWGYGGFGWGPAKIAPRAIWAAYQNDSARLPGAMAEYKTEFLKYLNEDGVMMDGATYATRRYVGHRMVKYGFMNVAEYSGIDRSYYNNPKIRNFYEWVFLGGVTPAGHLVVFNDTFNVSTIVNTQYNTMLFAAAKFGSAAAQAAARIAAMNNTAPGELMTYILMDSSLPAPNPPQSKVWPKSQAAFWERSLSPDALFGALWNNTTLDGHAHFETNSLFLAGYGTTLLTNAGYTTFGQGAPGFDWSYVHDNAISSNTLTFNNQNHSSKTGEGFTENLLSPTLDYAAAKADAAVSGQHIRNFFFAQPVGTNGYFFTVDEVTGLASDSVQTYFHPQASNVSTTQANQEYKWQITRDINSATNYGTNPVTLSIFLATPPTTSVALKDGALLGTGKYLIGKYLESNYALTNGKRNIITILFPADSTHTKATLARISGSGFTGASVTQAAATDYILESSDGAEKSFSSLQFKGAITFTRMTSNVLSMYFSKQGTKVMASGGVGFLSSSPVTISMKGTAGQIISPSTNVTFFMPGIQQVKIDNQNAPALSQSAGQVQVAVPSGTHTISLVTGAISSPSPSPSSLPTPTPSTSPLPSPTPISECSRADINRDTTVNLSDYSILVSNFLKNPLSNSRADINGDGQANLIDFSILIRYFLRTC